MLKAGRIKVAAGDMLATIFFLRKAGVLKIIDNIIL